MKTPKKPRTPKPSSYPGALPAEFVALVKQLMPETRAEAKLAAAAAEFVGGLLVAFGRMIEDALVLRVPTFDDLRFERLAAAARAFADLPPPSPPPRRRPRSPRKSSLN